MDGCHLLVIENYQPLSFQLLSSLSHSSLFRTLMKDLLNFYTVCSVYFLITSVFFIFYLSMVIFGHTSKLSPNSLILSEVLSDLVFNLSSEFLIDYCIFCSEFFKIGNRNRNFLFYFFQFPVHFLKILFIYF